MIPPLKMKEREAHNLSLNIIDWRRTPIADYLVIALIEVYRLIDQNSNRFYL